MFFAGLLVASGAPETAVEPAADAPGAVVLKRNGGWCWFQDPRAILLRDGTLVFNSLAGDDGAGADAGDLWVSAWKPGSATAQHFELHDKFGRDDHNVAALLERPDGRVLAVYGKHNNDSLQRWRISKTAGSITGWTEEQTLDAGGRYTYSNLYQLPAESGRIYNFSRARGFNPNCTISEDGGETWRYGWRLLSWTAEDLKGRAGTSGIDGRRPYVRYASNAQDAIHFVTTEDHPRAFDNSIYHGFYRDGKLRDSAGKVLGDPGIDGTSKLRPDSFTRVYQGGADAVAWTVDLEIAPSTGLPVTVFSVQRGSGAYRGMRAAEGDGADHRYHYARFDGSRWVEHEMAYAGSRLYAGEDDYTGLAAIDPQDPAVVVISTNADPSTGAPLVSRADGKRHWELFRGKTQDGGATWQWEALTRDSKRDHLRPMIPSNPGGQRMILWLAGDFKSFTDYRLDVCALREER
jgi:BNR repeat-containing family member